MRGESSSRAAPLLLFLAALFFRLWHVVSIRPLPSFAHPYEGLDAEVYTALARRIAAGELFPPGLADAAPLYAHWLGAILRITGDAAGAPRLAQAALGAAAVVLLGKAGTLLAGRRVGLVAGAIAAIYPPLLLYEGTIQSAALVPFLSTALLVVLIYAQMNRRAAAAGGLLLALSILNRPDLLPLLLLLPLWLARSAAGRRGALVLTVSALALLVPYGALTSARSGGLVPVSAHGGIHFYLGNHPGASGTLSPAPGIRPTPEGFARDARVRARRETGREMTRAEVSRFWFRKGIAAIAASPVRYARLLGRKTFLFWNDYEIPNNEDLYFLRRFSPPLRLPLPLFGLVAPFALYGVLFGGFRRRGRSLLAMFPALLFATALLFFVTGRYRLPALPPMILLAAGGGAAFARAVRRRRPAALLVVPFLLFCNLPARRFDFAGPETRLAGSYGEARDAAAAEAAYRRAMAIRPERAEARRGLARLLEETGRAAEAEALYRRLAAPAGEARTGANDLAAFLARRGRVAEAAALLDSILRSDPGDPTALANLGACRMEAGEDSVAATLLERAIRIDPEAAEAHLNLALLRTGQGRLNEAIEQFHRHLELDPFSKKGLFNAGAAHAMRGEVEEALRLWERLGAIDPDYPNLEENVGRARRLLENGRRGGNR